MPARPPHPALRPYLEGPLVGYRDHLDPRAVHHGLPSATVTFVVSFERPLDTAWLGTPERNDSYWTLAAGLHAAPALIRTHGVQHGIQIALTPAGARALLGLPAGALGEVIAHQGDLPGGLGESVAHELAGIDGWGARFDRLEQHLLTRLAATADPVGVVAPEVREAWRLLRASGGRARVAEVAERVGWSRRRLLGRFTDEYGVGPKTAARIVRFERAHRMARAGVPYVEVAARCGYADQAHLAHEFAAMAGRTPGQAAAAAYHVPA
ncbi:MAG: helix-turn-helix domain-containing protein [Nocardioides sp.]|uniref:helix-turn-helix transcriptional regulator n=1 Tax=Nocardioides sp. TaxID=35761 RepID=UPI003F07B417